MIRTQFSTLTDVEFVAMLLNGGELSDVELELVTRLEAAIDLLEDLKEHVAVVSEESSKAAHAFDAVPEGVPV